MTLDDLIAVLARHQGWIRRAVWVVFLAGVLSFLVRGADNPADPHVVTATRTPLTGFPEVVLHVIEPKGGFLEWCAMLAASQAARERGLMAQSTMRGYDAMVFRFAAPSSDSFYMYQTVMPLSIAWFDANGRYVSQTDMPPCSAIDPDACPVFHAKAPYTTAIEVPKGRLAALGLVPGSAVSFPDGQCR